MSVRLSDDMLPGTYSAACEAARIVSKFGKPTVECSFRVIDGEHFGTALPGWFHIKIVGDCVMPGCQYTKVCELVLGREIEPGDDIDPEAVLVGKKLKVGVRFRATDGKRLSAQDENTRKDGKDFLRVSSVLGEVSL
jgi:hypothetical protein